MVATPRNAVVILLDSLNRHMLGAYGGTEFETPVLDAFAKTAVRFDNHYTGSLPCMPARHDILCGALDFLWRPWGSVEIWEDAITYELIPYLEKKYRALGGGWARFMYEDQETLVQAGDVIHQRPGIRHYLFDYSPDMEYLEIVSPADFKTVDVEAVCEIPAPTPWN